ncbi:MAG: class I SAM-dependent RNA methyltransferase [Ruminococcaceae bacterium]|nr:class I SAM-dependent RNA methyltransferase [Oscillospiraceae bacterium]
MTKFTFVVPCLFGLEGLAADELRRLELENVRAENGRVLFDGGWEAMAMANLWLRTGERVLLRLCSVPAKSFEELFQATYAVPLEDFIPKDGKFPVKGHSLNSRLHSVPDCQAIVKRAAAKRLGEKYGIGWLPETGAMHQLQFSLMHDQFELFLDTTGAGLHKRGYRAVGNEAPLRETLAAGMIQLTRYRGRDFFWDPFCGSGTIPIEAALIAVNRAPGLGRRFAAESFPCAEQGVFDRLRKEAPDREYHGEYRILGSDNDPTCISLSMSNARKAGVAKLITFKDGDATKMDLPSREGIIVCNPPYGQRMLEQRQVQGLVQAFGRHLKFSDGWKKYIISSEPEFEHYYGRRADKRRKLYNGMIPCEYYMYLGGRKK